VHRWHDHGPGDDVIVVANFADRSWDDLCIGLPAGGRWRVRFNGDSPAYALDFGGHEVFDTEAAEEPADGQPFSALVGIGEYSVVVLSQDP
jgi:1,4-alpha-glucan branching enzyme